MSLEYMTVAIHRLMSPEGHLYTKKVYKVPNTTSHEEVKRRIYERERRSMGNLIAKNMTQATWEKTNSIIIYTPIDLP